MNNNHSTQKFRQCQGKLQCGETQRERDFISFRKYISTTTIQFPSKRNSLTTHKTSPTIFCLGKRAKSALLYDLPKNQHLEKCASIYFMDCFVRPCCSKKNPPNNLENCAKQCLDFRALFPLMYGLYGSVQYDLQHNNKYQHSHT
jgi:hypothetical protein